MDWRFQGGPFDGARHPDMWERPPDEVVIYECRSCADQHVVLVEDFKKLIDPDTVKRDARYVLAKIDKKGALYRWADENVNPPDSVYEDESVRIRELQPA